MTCKRILRLSQRHLGSGVLIQCQCKLLQATAAAAEEVTRSKQEKEAAEAARVQGGGVVEKAVSEVTKDGLECRDGNDDGGQKVSSDVVNDKKE